MKISDLQFEYPENLIGLEPQKPSRVMMVKNAEPEEIPWKNFLELFQKGDLLVVNDTQVLRRRVFAGELEILFLKNESENFWQVLFPSKKFKVGDKILLPDNVEMTLVSKGRPQKVSLSQKLTEDYFLKYGELPLPPYIQRARQARHNQKDDLSWYQTVWAEKPGSFAAPTASLHFTTEDLNYLKNKGVHLCTVTLHVGLGTFLPVTTEDLNDHSMHVEELEIQKDVWEKILNAKKNGTTVWSLGTTSTRAIESVALGLIQKDDFGNFRGETGILIQPGYEFQIVDRLLTNFHQPESTLLALVAAFSELNTVKACYQWAIQRKFRLFSYGDLSCWIKK